MLASGSALHLVWKEFDATKAVVHWQISPRQRAAVDPRTIADTEDASDNPILVPDRSRVYLSWLTKIGLSPDPAEDQP